MKFCPTCQTRYDEEIIRFCTKDGTPLVDEEQPNFIAMPSESTDADEADDFGAETVIRRKPPVVVPEDVPAPAPDTESAQRLVIPTGEPVVEQQVRSKKIVTQQQPPPRKSNTASVVLLTVLGTIAVLAGAGVVYYILSRDDDNAVNANRNINLNTNTEDTNLNTNLNVNDPLFNVNANVNVNANANANANVKTPTPTPSRTPTPSPSPSPANTNTNANANANVNANASPTRTPPANTRPNVSPSPAETPPAPPANRPVNVGNLNSRAVSLPKPAYPPAARQMNAAGQVPVQVLVDEGGNVLSARATNGHPLLRQAAEAAARQSKFNPVKVNGKNVQAIGTVVYNFVNQ